MHQTTPEFAENSRPFQGLKFLVMLESPPILSTITYSSSFTSKELQIHEYSLQISLPPSFSQKTKTSFIVEEIHGHCKKILQIKPNHIFKS